MEQQTHRFARFSASLGLAAALALGAVVPAFAVDDTDNSTASATVTGGALVLDGVPPTTSFSGGTLNGTPKTSTASLDADVNDATGTGDGWTLSISAERFENEDGKLLAANALTVTAVDVACKNSGECPNDVADRSGLSQVVDTSAGTLLTAAADTGMGYFTTDTSLSLAVPASTYAGTYESTITLTLAATP
jgi:hypothetical protein